MRSGIMRAFSGGSMLATVLILGVAALFLYVAFSKGRASASSPASDEEGMETYDPVRTATYKVYAQAWGHHKHDE